MIRDRAATVITCEHRAAPSHTARTPSVPDPEESPCRHIPRALIPSSPTALLSTPGAEPARPGTGPPRGCSPRCSASSRTRRSSSPTRPAAADSRLDSLSLDDGSSSASGPPRRLRQLARRPRHDRPSPATASQRRPQHAVPARRTVRPARSATRCGSSPAPAASSASTAPPSATSSASSPPPSPPTPGSTTPPSPPPRSPTSTTPSSKATRPATPGSSPTRAASASPPPTPPAGPPRPAARHRLPWIAVSTRLAAVPGRRPPRPPPSPLYAAGARPRHPRPLRPPSCATAASTRADYLYLPVHPWQWDESSLPLFAPAIADGAIVPLPTDGDLRLAAAVHPHLPQRQPAPTGTRVKLPLSILNTLVWRGLPTERTLAAPAVTAWVHGLRDADPFLRDDVPGHPARRGRLRHRRAPASTTSSPRSRTSTRNSSARSGASPCRPASHPANAPARSPPSSTPTRAGRSFTAELVARSGLAPAVWLQPPLRRPAAARCCTSSTATARSSPRTARTPSSSSTSTTSPSGSRSRTSSTTSTSAPSRCPSTTPCPTEVRDGPAHRGAAPSSPSSSTPGSSSASSAISPRSARSSWACPRSEFWSLVRAEILRHHARFPELKERFELFDLLTPAIERLCLNRNRLHVDGYRDRPEPPARRRSTAPFPTRCTRPSDPGVTAVVSGAP